MGSTGNGASNSYVDLERIRKHDGYVYFWELFDYGEPAKSGTLSGKAYKKGDCKLFRYKILSDSYYNVPMGKGTSATSSNTPDKDWHYPPPNSISEGVLKRVCSQ